MYRANFVRLLISIAAVLLIAGGCSKVNNTQPLAESQTEEISVNASPERMSEWNDWKFGLFIHWGAWSQKHEGAIWNITKQYTPEEREKAFDLIKTFDPVKYDPKQWARVAKDAGMKYVVFVTKHHDGFCNYDTKLTDLRVTHSDCPYSKRPNPDLTRQLVDAFRAEGIAIGFYYSHIDWHHKDAKLFSRSHWDYDDSLIASDPASWKRFVEFETEQVRELLTNYGKVDILWYDISWPKQGLKDTVPMLEMARRIQPGIIINNRGTGDFGDFQTPEQFIPNAPAGEYWETNMTISGTQPGWSGFWYKGPQASYKSSEEIVHKLADVSAKGGNFLLNSGPKPDGQLPQGEIDTLKGVGRWMKVNSEAIYATERSPWGMPPAWGRITKADDKVYLIVFDWSADVELELPKEKIKKAYLLKDKTKVEVKSTSAGKAVSFVLPKKAPTPYASVIVVQYKGDLNVTAKWPELEERKVIKRKVPKNQSPNLADKKGVITLKPERAFIHGEQLTYQPNRNNIGNWMKATEYPYWKIKLDTGGKYNVEITYGCGPDHKGQAYRVLSGESHVDSTTEDTGGIKQYKAYKLGQMSLNAGESFIYVKATSTIATALMNLKELKLTPVK